MSGVDVFSISQRWKPYALVPVLADGLIIDPFAQFKLPPL
ncbi:MAG: hypothetical protein RLZZ153_594 [Pseudomonadota bacterium]|jgi:hypothetical protein